MTKSLSKLRKKYKKLTVVKNRDQYVVISLNMIPVDDHEVVVFKIKDLETGGYLLKTPSQIIHEPAIAFRLGKEDLMRVSYHAGYEFGSVH